MTKISLSLMKILYVLCEMICWQKERVAYAHAHTDMHIPLILISHLFHTHTNTNTNVNTKNTHQPNKIKPKWKHAWLHSHKTEHRDRAKTKGKKAQQQLSISASYDGVIENGFAAIRYVTKRMYWDTSTKWTNMYDCVMYTCESHIKRKITKWKNSHRRITVNCAIFVCELNNILPVLFHSHFVPLFL